MVKKYDLKAMLLEIQEDEDSLQEGSQKPLSQEEIRRLRGAGQILSLETIIANHRREHPGGQLLEAELEFERNRYVYELRRLGDDGGVRKFEYNARSGELWRVERN